MKGVEKVKYLSADDGAVDGSDSTVRPSHVPATFTSGCLRPGGGIFDFAFFPVGKKRAPGEGPTLGRSRFKREDSVSPSSIKAAQQGAPTNPPPTLRCFSSVQEHPLLREPARVLQDAGRENRESKNRRRSFVLCANGLGPDGRVEDNPIAPANLRATMS